MYDEKARAVLAKGATLLPAVIRTLENLPEPWTQDVVKASLEELAGVESIKTGKLLSTIRAALFGRMEGPDIPASMAILGKEESLTRIGNALFMMEKL